MQRLLMVLWVSLLFAGCTKEKGARVDIYLLKSHQIGLNQATNPVTTTITDAVLDNTPLVADKDIKSYDKDTHTFTLRKNLRSTLGNFGPDKAFAVTIDGSPVYFGRFHPAFLSSIVFGLATITPEFVTGDEIKIDFVQLDGSPFLKGLDKRNDSRILQALKVSQRLR